MSFTIFEEIKIEDEMKGSREISFLLQIFIFSCVESKEFIIPNIKDDIETRRKRICLILF